MPKPYVKAKGQSLDQTLEWIITIPRFQLTSSQKRKRTIRFHFQVTNNAQVHLIVHIQIQSLTPLLQFHSKQVKAIGRDRIKEESTTFSQIRKKSIAPQQTQRLDFTLYYLPHLSVQSQSPLGFEYSIVAFETEGKIVTHTDLYRVLLSRK